MGWIIPIETCHRSKLTKILKTLLIVHSGCLRQFPWALWTSEPSDYSGPEARRGSNRKVTTLLKLSFARPAGAEHPLGLGWKGIFYSLGFPTVISTAMVPRISSWTKFFASELFPYIFSNCSNVTLGIKLSIECCKGWWIKLTPSTFETTWDTILSLWQSCICLSGG